MLLPEGGQTEFWKRQDVISREQQAVEGLQHPTPAPMMGSGVGGGRYTLVLTPHPTKKPLSITIRSLLIHSKVRSSPFTKNINK
jgi:hypothetical protein